MTTERPWGIDIVGPRALRTLPFDVPSPAYDEVQIRIHACGVCASDLYRYANAKVDTQGYYYPRPTFGHEGVGEIVALGDGVKRRSAVSGLAVHDHVFTVGGGHAMAELVNIHEDRVGKLPKDYHVTGSRDCVTLGNREWRLCVAEPVTCVLSAVHQAGIYPGDRIVILGQGYMGNLVAQALSKASYQRPDAIEPIRYRFNMAERAGFVTLRDPPYSHESCYDVVFDCAGTQSSLIASTRLGAKGARIVIVAQSHMELVVDFDAFHLGGFKVIHASPRVDPNFLRLVDRTTRVLSTFDQSRLVTHVSAMTGAKAIFEDGVAQANSYVKGVVLFS